MAGPERLSLSQKPILAALAMLISIPCTVTVADRVPPLEADQWRVSDCHLYDRAADSVIVSRAKPVV